MKYKTEDLLLRCPFVFHDENGSPSVTITWTTLSFGMLTPLVNKSHLNVLFYKAFIRVLDVLGSNDGARGRNRTGTVFLPRDFKSLASTNFATRALCNAHCTCIETARECFSLMHL